MFQVKAKYIFGCTDINMAKQKIILYKNVNSRTKGQRKLMVPKE